MKYKFKKSIVALILMTGIAMIFSTNANANTNQNTPIVVFEKEYSSVLNKRCFKDTNTMGVFLPANSVIMNEAFRDSDVRFVYMEDNCIVIPNAFSFSKNFTVFTEDTNLVNALNEEYLRDVEIIIPSLAISEEKTITTCSNFFVLPNKTNVVVSAEIETDYLVIPPNVETLRIKNPSQIKGIYVLGNNQCKTIVSEDNWSSLQWIRTDGAMDFLPDLLSKTTQRTLLLVNNANYEDATERFFHENVLIIASTPNENDDSFGELLTKGCDYQNNMVLLPDGIGIGDGSIDLQDMGVTISAKEYNAEQVELTITTDFPFNQTSFVKYVPIRFEESSENNNEDDTLKNDTTSEETDAETEVEKNPYKKQDPYEKAKEYLYTKKSQYTPFEKQPSDAEKSYPVKVKDAEKKEADIKDEAEIEYSTPTPEKKSITSDTIVFTNEGITARKQKAVSLFSVGNLQYKIIGDNEVCVIGINKNRKNLTIPDKVRYQQRTYSVTAIGNYACSNNQKLKRVTIGKNVKQIYNGAFEKCKKLKTVVIKANNLKEISKTAFIGTHKKITIQLPKSKENEYHPLLSKLSIKNIVTK